MIVILKLLISLIFVAAVVQKFTGKVAPNREQGHERWPDAALAAS